MTFNDTYVIFDIARWFLQTKEVTKHKKLQKLCYLSLAWSLVEFDKPLFSDTFDARVQGPVSRSLYSKLTKSPKGIPIKRNVLNSISKKITEETVIKFLEHIWDDYGKFSGEALEAIITQYDKAFSAAYKKGNNSNLACAKIDNNLIKDYYAPIKV